MYRQLGIECKKRCFHSTTAQYRNIKPGFFTSLLGSTDRNTRQPKEVLAAYPLKSSKETHSSKTPPVASKMLVRDFIDDSLYNPHYGYYSKPSISPYMEFEEMEQEEDYMQYIRRLSKSKGRVHHHNIQQFRYSLTELFKVISGLKRSLCEIEGLLLMHLFVYSRGMAMPLQNIWSPNIN